MGLWSDSAFQVLLSGRNGPSSQSHSVIGWVHPKRGESSKAKQTRRKLTANHFPQQATSRAGPTCVWPLASVHFPWQDASCTGCCGSQWLISTGPHLQVLGIVVTPGISAHAETAFGVGSLASVFVGGIQEDPQTRLPSVPPSQNQRGVIFQRKCGTLNEKFAICVSFTANQAAEGLSSGKKTFKTRCKCHVVI